MTYNGIILTGSINISAGSRHERIDGDFNETCLKKLLYIFDIAAEKNLLVVMGGEVFKKQFDVKDLNLIIKAVSKHKNRILIIEGKSDIQRNGLPNELSTSSILASTGLTEIIRRPLKKFVPNTKDNSNENGFEISFESETPIGDLDEDFPRGIIIRYLENGLKPKELIVRFNEGNSSIHKVSDDSLILDIGPLVRSSKYLTNTIPTAAIINNIGIVELIQLPHIKHVFDNSDTLILKSKTIESRFSKQLRDETKRFISNEKPETFIENEISVIANELNATGESINIIRSLLEATKINTSIIIDEIQGAT